MKKTAYLLVVLSIIAMPLVCAAAVDEVYRVIEKSDTKALRNLCNSALFNVSKEDKKALVEAAHNKTDQLHLNINNFGLNDAGRLTLGIPSTLLGVAMVILGLSARGFAAIAESMADSEEDEFALAGLNYLSIPTLLFGGVFSYLGIDNIAKALTHHDNKTKYDRALAVEAMIRRIKARQAH